MFSLFTQATLLYAQSEYELLQPLPEIGDTTTGLSYLPALFTLLVGITTLLAVVWIVFGGIQYMSSDAIGGKSAGKKKIQDALVGLLLAGASWIILYTINPELLNVNLAQNEALTTKSWVAVVTKTELKTNPATLELETKITTETVYGTTQEECEEELKKSGGASIGCTPSTSVIPSGYISYTERKQQQEEGLKSLKEAEKIFKDMYDISFFDYIASDLPNTTPVQKDSLEEKLSELGPGFYTIKELENTDILSVTGPFETAEGCEQYVDFEKLYTANAPNAPAREKNPVNITCQTNP